MATITVGSGSMVTAETGVGNVYDVDGGALTIGALQLNPELDTTVNLQGMAALIIQPQIVGLDLSSVHFSGEGNIIAFEDAANAVGPGGGPVDLSNSGFGSTDGFAFPGSDAISTESYDPATGALVLTIAGATRTILVTTGLDPTDFHVASADGVTGIAYVACFARGTRIATPLGDIAVEDLCAEDHVSLARGGSARVAWIGRRRMRPAASERPDTVQPVAVAPGALGDGLPRRELRMSPEHALLIDGALVPVGLLVNGSSIRQLEVETVEYFHVELDRHDVILAEGVAAESYIDTGNRSMFANAPIAALHAEIAPATAERPSHVPLCAEMLFEGPQLDAIRARIDRCASLRDQAAAPLRAAG